MAGFAEASEAAAYDKQLGDEHVLSNDFHVVFCIVCLWVQSACVGGLDGLE